jgi:hypothetical protein
LLGITKLEHRRVRSGLDLHDSRIDSVEISESDVHVHFSHAYIHKSKGTPGRDSGSGWSQEALLVISNALITDSPLPPLPNTISDGYLKVGGIAHTLLPLPFTRRADVSLSLVFADGTNLDVSGRGAAVQLLGQAIYLEDF